MEAGWPPRLQSACAFYLGGTRAFATFADLEFDGFAFAKVTALYFGMVDEEISAPFLLEKSITFVFTEPFNDTTWH